MRLFFLALLTLFAAFPQNREILDLIDRSRSLPPEFAADSLLRIAVKAELVPAKEKRIELIDEAFRLAAHAQMAVPLRGRGYHTDTRPGWREFASETGLNSLALQTRAILAMRGLDSTRLRRMVAEARPLDDQPGTCKEPQRPSLEIWYSTLLEVIQDAFTAKEIKDGEPVRWLARHIMAITTPAQLSGAMRAITMPVEPILNAYAAALPNIGNDWIAFVLAEGDIPFSPQTAVAARDYIVRNFRGTRCAPGPWIRKVADVPMPVDRFNDFLKKQQPPLAVDPIDPTKVEANRSDEGYKLEEFWTSPKSKEVMLALKWLNHGNRDLPGDKRFWTLEERKLPEWNEHYLALLKLMEGWTADDEPSPADYFHMKAHTYMLLTELTPPGNQRTNAFRNLISWLNSSYNDRVPHAEWFTHAHRLLRAKSVEPWLLDELEQNGNLVLSHYARMQKKAPGK